MMEIKETGNKEEWENFLLGCSEKTFLQSWEWGDFNIAMGNKIWRFGIFYGQNLHGIALVIKIVAKRGIFLFIPHGPVINQNLELADKKEILKMFLLLLKKLASEEGASFIRISPIFENNSKNREIFSELGFKNAPMHASAYEATWKLDICKPEQELLKNMRKTTRYLIKKWAENQDVLVEKTTDINKIKIYQELNKKVSKRQKFVPFSEKFIENEFKIFSKDNRALLLFGKYKGEIAAGAMVIFWSGVGFYHQAASLKKFAKYSIPYLLQWEAIKEAKKRGCVIYDFWGFADPKIFPNHPWAGPTLFKMGFGGYKKEFLRTQDYIISQKYWISYIIERIRKSWRNL